MAAVRREKKNRFELVKEMAKPAILLAVLLAAQIAPLSPQLTSFQPSAQAQMQGLAAKPKLVVLLVADQLSYNSLMRFQDKLSGGGIRYLSESGANYTNCRYLQATTQAACGDATIATGASPWATGIVGDLWFDRRKNKAISAVADESAPLTGANSGGASSKFLQGTTIGDQMKLATNGRSKVFSLAVRDSQALLLGGRLANMAMWFDTRTGNFVSSAQYSRDLPTWVKGFNDQRQAEKYVAKPWQRLLPETAYGASSRDDYTNERALPSDGKAFPHMISGTTAGEGAYSTLAMTPMANQMVLDLAKEAIDKEGLGTHSDTDLLSIGLSAGGELINNFGPYSQESQDLVLRMDQGISALLGHLEQKVGLNNCLIIFTANRGAQAIPEFLKERGLDSGRIDPKTFKTFLDTSLDNRLGQDDWIEAFEPPNLYLNFSAIDKNKYRQPDVEALAAKVAHSVPGIAEVITSAQLYSNQLPNGPYSEGVRKSYYWGRSGECYVIPKPGYVFSSESTGTASGAPYSYDSQVPLLLHGFGIEGGKHSETVSPSDIAPTIAALLNIETPSLSEGKVLVTGIAPIQGPPRPRTMATEAAPQ
ncbi:alkaline phosphatase family protein [bacterium]|nr:alkaline phosphatase family protein [bacterium]